MVLVHQYAGFIFAAYLIVVCGSGTTLVLLEDQISGYRDYLMLRVPTQKQKLSLAEMVAIVERANPAKRVYHDIFRVVFRWMRIRTRYAGRNSPHGCDDSTRITEKYSRRLSGSLHPIGHFVRPAS